MADPLGSTPAIIVGTGVGTAASTALEAAVELPRQKVWRDNPNKLLDPGVVARLVAQGGVTLGAGREDARREGYTADKFDALVYLAQTVPAIAEALTLWRRDRIGDDLFRHVLTKAGLDTRYVGPIIATKDDEPLAVAQTALAVVRSLLDSHGLLVGENDTRGGKIAPTPISPLDPRTEAAKWGVDTERLRVLINSIGLPMALDSAAQSVFRGIIEKPDFYLAVAQGDTRPAWADAIFEHSRQIPSVADYVNAHIRGWITRAEMHDGAARHGMSAADVDLLYLRTGRPAAPGQMATAAARGINGPDGVPMNREQFLKGIAESDIRPEWGEMLWESRYLYPPLFQLTRLVQGGAISADTAREWAVKDRYPPEVVNALHAYWSQSATTPKESTTHPWRARAGAQLWATLHKAYLAADATDDDAVLVFREIGVSQDSDDVILRRWKLERDLTRARLTAAQLKKAYTKATPNPLTGQPWTREEALAELLDRGWNTQDANTFLDL